MPTYVYKFIDTGETIEVQQAFTDDALTEAEHPATGKNDEGQEGVHAGRRHVQGRRFLQDRQPRRKAKSSSTPRRRRTRHPTRRRRSPTSTSTSSESGQVERLRSELEHARRPRASSTTPAKTVVDRPTERLIAADTVGLRLPPNRRLDLSREVCMHQLAWVRLMVARHPWIYWLAIAVVAGWLVALGAAAGAGRCRRRATIVGRAVRRCGSRRPRSSPAQPITADASQRSRGRGAGRRRGCRALTERSPGSTSGPARSSSTPTSPPADRPASSPTAGSRSPCAAPVEHFAIGDHLDVYSGDQLVGAGVVVDVGDRT